LNFILKNKTKRKKEKKRKKNDKVQICKAICHGYEVLGYMAQAEIFVTQLMAKLEKLISLVEQAGHTSPASIEVERGERREEKIKKSDRRE
jgi:hypothetical protein